MITGLQDDEVELMDEEFSDNEDEVAETYLLRTLRDSRLMMNIKMIGSMNGTKIYHGLMRNHRQTLEFGQNQNQAYHIGNSLHYQYLEWYEALEDSELKNEALRNKAIMEGLISDDESYNDCGRRWKSYEINYHDYNKGEYENETHEEGHEICGIETCKGVLNLGPEYVRDAKMEEWLTRGTSVKGKKLMKLVKYQSSGILCVIVVMLEYRRISTHILAHKLNLENLPSKISGYFDQFQPSQFLVIYQPPQETNKKILQARENLMEAIQAFLKKYDHIPPREKCMALWLAEERFLKFKQTLEEGKNQPENVQELLLKLLNDLQILNKMQLKQEEQAAKICTPYWKCPIFDDDDDEEYTIQVREYYKKFPVAITPNFPITDSLIMEDEHLDTISETKSDEENKSSVEDHLTYPVDDESFSDEDVPKENFKIYSNSLFDEEIISTKIDPHHFNAESDLIESLLNRDTSIVSSPKFDSLLEEFSDELAHIDLISPKIDEANFDPEEEIRLVEKLLYDNSSPRPPEELNFWRRARVKIYDVVIKSFSPSPIPVEDSDSLMEEIDIFLLILTTKVVDDISDNSTRELYVHMPNVFPTLYPVFDTLLPFSSENKDKVFNPRILASKEEKSPHLLSHRGFKVFQLINDSESPMMIYGEDILILDDLFLHFYLDQLKYRGSSQAQDSVNKNKRFDCPNYEASHARGFVLRSLELQSFAYFYMGIQNTKSYRLTFMFEHT
ncbi:hypothetical protein Tco_1263233 [Tanacetum coccineum]